MTIFDKNNNTIFSDIPGVERLRIAMEKIAKQYCSAFYKIM